MAQCPHLLVKLSQRLLLLIPILELLKPLQVLLQRGRLHEGEETAKLLQLGGGGGKRDRNSVSVIKWPMVTGALEPPTLLQQLLSPPRKWKET